MTKLCEVDDKLIILLVGTRKSILKMKVEIRDCLKLFALKSIVQVGIDCTRSHSNSYTFKEICKKNIPFHTLSEDLYQKIDPRS